MVPPFWVRSILRRAGSVSLLRNCAREIRAVRRAHDAGGRVRERVRQRALAGSKYARALADDVAKRAPEGAETLPSGVKSDLGDRQGCIGAQRGCSLDAPAQEVSMRRDAERLLERSREVGFGHAAHACEPPYRPWLLRRNVPGGLRTPQTAQK